MSGAVIRGEIVERADGVPLFVEELTKAVVEAGDSGPGIEKTLGALAPALYVQQARIRGGGDPACGSGFMPFLRLGRRPGASPPMRMLHHGPDPSRSTEYKVVARSIVASWRAPLRSFAFPLG
jgi:hypothetical protein